jgi:capsular exopolysaccharide synthesis family protein
VNDTRPLTVFWRRRLTILAAIGVAVAVAVAVSSSLPRIYQATATLVVAQDVESQTFDSVQAAQVTARSYTTLLQSRRLAADVAGRIGGRVGDVASSVSFEAVPETQLIRIVAEDQSPERAQSLANAYADGFVRYSTRELSSITRSTVSVADQASRPAGPVRPKPLVYGLLAAILGAAAGVGLAFLRERFDTRLRSIEDVEAAVAPVPVLARIPVRDGDGASAAAFAEAFRVLHAALALLPDARQARTLAITSPARGDGRTTAAAELARAAARGGVHVLAVDGDARRPRLAQALGVTGPAGQGLSDYVAGVADLDDVVVDTADAHLRVLPNGAEPAPLSTLLGSGPGEQRLLELERQASLVIFDCPPLTLGADAVALAGRADAVLVVVDASRATSDGLEDVRRRLRAIDAQWVGVVLNRDSALELRAYDADGREERPARPVEAPRSVSTSA